MPCPASQLVPCMHYLLLTATWRSTYESQSYEADILLCVLELATTDLPNVVRTTIVERKKRRRHIIVPMKSPGIEWRTCNENANTNAFLLWTHSYIKLGCSALKNYRNAQYYFSSKCFKLNNIPSLCALN